MESIKERYIRYSIGIINIILLMKVLKDCFKISTYRYDIVLLLILLGIFIYVFFTKILISKKLKLLFITATLIICLRLLLKNSHELFRSLLTMYIGNFSIIIPSILKGNEIVFKEFLPTFIIAVPLLTSTFLWISKRFIKIPTIFSIALFIVSWYLVFYMMIIPNIKYLIAVIIYTLGCDEYVKRSKDYRGRELKASIKLHQILIFLIIITIAITTITNIMPQDYKGKSLDGIITFMENKFLDKGEEINYAEKALKRSYTLKDSGYSDSSVILGGRVKLNGRLALIVESDRPYYLRGKIKDIYTGNTWLESNNKLIESKEFSSYGNEENGITYLIGARSDFNYVGEKTIKITHKPEILTTTYFTPNGTTDVISEKERLFLNNIPLFLTDTIIDSTYEVKLISHGDYDNYLQGIENTDNREIFEEERYKTLLREYGLKDEEYYVKLEELVDVTDSKELQSYNKFKWQYMNYLQVPSTVEEGVYELAYEILSKEAEDKNVSSEDLTADEKALAIMNYLRKNYTYETDVQGGEYKDFVSDFLLDKKEGYCTYFASATVIMCRIAGIPARYAEGFNMTTENEVNGKYKITNKDAHAWAEVLVNPYRDQWAVADSVPKEEEEENTPTDHKDIDNEEQEINKPNKNDNSSSGIENTEEGDGEKNEFTWVHLSLLLLTIIILFIAITLLSFYTEKRKILRSKSIIPLYNYYLRRLKTIKIVRADYKGDREFAEGIQDKELRERIVEIVNLVYSEYYGGDINNNIDKREGLNYIEGYIKERINTSNYYMKKYFSRK